jgi:hypothetical protein
MRSEAKRKGDALAKARREARATLVTNAERWAAFKPEVARALALLRGLPIFSTSSGAEAGAEAGAESAPEVLLKTKEVTPPTRASASEYVVRRGGKRPRKAQQESLAGVDLIAPEIRLEYQTLRELAAKSWRVLGVQIWTAPEPTDEMLMTYAGWRKTRSFEDAIRMLRIRLNKRVKTGQVWNGPLQQLFEVKLTNGEKPFDWFSWLVSVESNSQDREVREIFEDYAARHRETRPSRAVAGGDEGTPAAVRNGPLPFIRPEVGSPERH